MSDSLVFFDKPSGLSTHSPDPARSLGFAESLASVAECELRVVHRLDKGTSGVLALATSRESAAEAAAAFAEGHARKTYLFVTASNAPERREFEVTSRIEREPSGFVSRESDANLENARTEFRWVRSSGRFALWEARPSTGRSHQIRLHAQSAGIPILGDDEHGGAPFARLCLHAARLELELPSGKVAADSEPPIFMTNLETCAQPRLAQWLAAHDRRERWMRSRADAAALSSLPFAADTSAWRRVHTDGGVLRSDRLGDVEWLGWFADAPPSERDRAEVLEFLHLIERPKWILQHRPDRGSGGGEPATWTSSDLPLRWTARENGVAYEFRRDQGLSSGLFLDQRANRLWTRANASGARVLNLFAYSCGFSACAAVGGADFVVSSDVSKRFLEWGRRNFELGGFAVDPRFEFRAIDSREYLAWAAKKGLRFDLVICDPPSFSRGSSGLFRIEKDFAALVRACALVLAPGGRALISTNYEGWNEAAFARELRAAARSAGSEFEAEPMAVPEWDFEAPLEPRQMKCGWVVRSS